MEINYPKRINTEAEIQALLWMKLRARYLDARLQVNTPNRYGGHSLLDIVVFREEKALCIIECKAWSPSYCRTAKYRKAHNTKQLTKYKKSFGLPVLICGSYKAIEPVSRIVFKICGLPDDKPLVPAPFIDKSLLRDKFRLGYPK